MLKNNSKLRFSNKDLETEKPQKKKNKVQFLCLYVCVFVLNSRTISFLLYKFLIFNDPLELANTKRSK